ncbi:hypothetical protein V6Z11_A11G211500 [Gossypium hirsutum]
MEWTTLQHLDLQHVARGILQPLQPHAAAFHHTQALVAAAIGTYIIVVRMSYSPACGQCVIAILEFFLDKVFRNEEIQNQHQHTQ